MFTADTYNGSKHWDNVTVIKEGTYIRDTTSSNEGYFRIQQCDLVPKIQGGMGRAAPYFRKGSFTNHYYSIIGSWTKIKKN